MSGAAPAERRPGRDRRRRSRSASSLEDGAAASTSGDSDLGLQGASRCVRTRRAASTAGRSTWSTSTTQSSAANLSRRRASCRTSTCSWSINDSAFAFLTYRWLLDHDVPLIGGGFDGNYYGAPGNEKVISAFGNSPPISGIQTTLTPKIMKTLGAKKVACVGYGVSPSSTAAVKELHAVRGPGRRARARVHEHVDRLRHQRRRSARARHEERGRRRRLVRDGSEHPPGVRAGPRAERRGDEGAAHGDRVRPPVARAAGVEDARAGHRLQHRMGAGRAEERRRRSGSRPT